jgi:hypothetical protein
LARQEREADQREAAQRRMMEDMKAQNEQLTRDKRRYKLSKQLKGF